MVVGHSDLELTRRLPSPLALCFLSITRRDPGAAAFLRFAELSIIYAIAILRAQAASLNLDFEETERPSFGARFGIARKLETAIMEMDSSPVFALSATDLKPHVRLLVEGRNAWAHRASRPSGLVPWSDLRDACTLILSHLCRGSVLLRANTFDDQLDPFVFFDLTGVSGSREPKQYMIQEDESEVATATAIFRSHDGLQFAANPLLQPHTLRDGGYGFKILLDDSSRVFVDPSESWNCDPAT